MSAFSSILICAILLICIGHYSSVGARESGVELIVTQKTADYVNSKVVSLLKSQLSGLSIPDLRFKRGKVYSIHLGPLRIGSSRISFGPSGATVVLSNLGISGSARWKYKRWFFRISGRIHVSLSSGHLSTTLSVASKGGRPDFNIGACSARASVKVRFSGGLFSWILNLFRGYISRRVERFLKDNTCRLLTNILNKQEAQLVTSYPTSLPIGKTLRFDFSLARDPKFGYGYLQIPFVGFTSPLVSSRELSYLARRYSSGSITSNVRTHRMLFFRLKPHTINAALLAHHRANSFNHEFELGHFGKSLDSIIGAGGAIIGGTKSQYCGNPSDCTIKLKIYTPHAPTIQLGYNSIRARARVVLDVDLVNSRRSVRVNLLKVSVDGLICANLRIRQRGNRLTAVIQITCARALSTSVKSLFGNFPSADVTQLINSLTAQLLPEANRYLSSGIPLQQPGSFTIKQPYVSIRPQYLEVGTNFVYNRWG